MVRSLQEEGFSFTYRMNEDDIIYGVGESNRGINKNIGMHRYGGIWTEITSLGGLIFC